ncbi:hypothetical protein RZS08_66300, partial [Arthrospira platensis SPKY1]|nr:hypothetical protein [Arthrospira platensis SPKY1]
GRADEVIASVLGDLDSGVVEGGMILDHADLECRHSGARRLGLGPDDRRVHDQEGAPALAEHAGGTIHRRHVEPGVPCRRKDHEIEQVDLAVDDVKGSTSTRKP